IRSTSYLLQPYEEDDEHTGIDGKALDKNLRSFLNDAANIRSEYIKNAIEHSDEEPKPISSAECRIIFVTPEERSSFMATENKTSVVLIKEIENMLNSLDDDEIASVELRVIWQNKRSKRSLYHFIRK
ncbi:unnamed protein product, partial [Owenia fusiformis]